MHSFVERRCETRHIGRQVRRFASIDSTSAYAASLASDPANHGVVILADEQTAGKGQFGRRWIAPPGSSVLMSVVLFPPPELRRATLMTAWAAVAVGETLLQATGWQARIKWPNDVLLLDRKVCGILIECGKAIVAGIGLNVAQSADEFKCAGLSGAGSLHSVTGRVFDPEQVADSLIGHLNQGYESLLRGELAVLENAWKWRLDLLGKDVDAEDNDGKVNRGRLRDVGFDGIVLENRGSELRLAPEMIRRLAEA